MKVTVKEQPKENKYPYIGRHITESNVIVLFTNGGKGTVLTELGGRKVGYHSNTWTEVEFIPFEGTIELSND